MRECASLAEELLLLRRTVLLGVRRQHTYGSVLASGDSENKKK